jgi:hypothetical protein
MPDFYLRDDSGRFAGSTAAGPAARTFTSFFEELKLRSPSPSGWVFLRQQDGTLAKVYVQGGYVNFPD